MTYYKVVDGKIVGQAISPPVGDSPEPGWMELYDSDPIVQVWKNPPSTQAPSQTVEVNWEGLYHDLIDPTQGLSIYQHIIMASSESLAVNTAFTVFSLVLTNTKQQDSLASALLMLINSLNEAGTPLHNDQRVVWNNLLTKNNFQLGSLFLGLVP